MRPRAICSSTPRSSWYSHASSPAEPVSTAVTRGSPGLCGRGSRRSTTTTPRLKFALGRDTVVVTVRLLARGRQTGMEVDARLGHLFLCRDERAVRWEIYITPPEALAAAGLRG
jgi:hypothetical protein